MQNDTKISDLEIEMLENRNEWRKRIHVDSHWKFGTKILNYVVDQIFRD